MIYPRKIKKLILEQMENDLTVVITGMRRVGKSFLLFDLFQTIKSEKKLLLDLEKAENRVVFKEEGIEAIVRNLEVLGLKLSEKIHGQKSPEKNRSYLFLDEIQNLPKLNSTLKYLTDHYQLKLIVTGFSSFYLKNLFSESLSGRKNVFELFPLDFGEFLIFRNIPVAPRVKDLKELASFNTKMMILRYQPLFEEYLLTGGFPQIVLADTKTDKGKLLKDILDSYIQIDAKTLSDFKSLDDLEKTVLLLPPRVGQKIDFSRLSSEVGISRPTLTAYLRFLQDTFVSFLLYPYSKSPDREISSQPKLYFCDNGLALALGQLGQGQLLENYIYNSLYPHFSLNYYQRKSGTEIDFIVDKKIGLEVKTFGNSRDFNRLRRTGKALGLDSCFLMSQKTGEGQSKEILPAFLLGFLDF